MVIDRELLPVVDSGSLLAAAVDVLAAPKAFRLLVVFACAGEPIVV